MRRCFIHIGTHRTGTTSIQHMLYKYRHALKRSGYLYPLSGLMSEHPGHHNLAWEISGDYRFQASLGTIADLIKEIRTVSEDVILSSEDFECALYNGTLFSDFVSLLQSNGFVVTPIIYLRPQIDYLPRIYLTLLLFQLDRTFAEVFDAVIDTGKFQWRDWIVNFDYRDMLTRTTGDGAIKCLLRAYDPVSKSVCCDFLNSLNLTFKDLGVPEEVLENKAKPLESYVWLFVQNRLSSGLLQHEDVKIENLSWQANTIGLSPRAKSQLIERFRESNQALEKQYGLESTFVKPLEVSEPELYIDELFTEALVSLSS